MARRRVLFIHNGLTDDFKIPLKAIPYDCSFSFRSDHEKILHDLKAVHFNLIICSLQSYKELPESICTDHNFLLIQKIFFDEKDSVAAQKESIRLGAVDFLPYPFDSDILSSKIERALELESYRQRIENIVNDQFNRIKSFHSGIIMMLANIVESRDGTTGEHVKHVSYYVRALARKMKEMNLYSKELSDELIEKLIDAAALHDIGKITIPDSILNKTSTLTDQEYEMMKNHAKAGGLIIKKNLKFLNESEFVKIASDIASCHHEKWDGSGYPFGKKGREIPLVARITTIADVFDALVSKRQYKEAMDVDEALNIMSKDEGKAFDPDILKVFLSMADELKLLIKELSDKAAL